MILGLTTATAGFIALTIRAVRGFRNEPLVREARVGAPAGELRRVVSGEKKAAVLQELLEGQPRPEDHPAAGVRPVDGTVEWLVDEAAASALTRRSR